MRIAVLLLSLCLASGISWACEIEKHAVMGAKGIEFYWWPKLAIPKGWVHDADASLALTSNVLHPKGQTFQDAPTVIYARAFYEPDPKKRGTLQEFIDRDLDGIRNGRAGVVTKELAPTESAAGRMRTFDCHKNGENFERVCYGSEGDFWLVFVISSKTDTALRRDLPVFIDMMRKYKK